MEEKLFIDLDKVEFVSTAHTTGLKKTLFSGNEAGSSLTQFAYGKLSGGEVIAPHQHQTMEEFFYFLQGKGVYVVGGEQISLKPGVAVRIPAATEHELHSEETLEFVYFGIAL